MAMPSSICGTGTERRLELRERIISTAQKARKMASMPEANDPLRCAVT